MPGKPQFGIDAPTLVLGFAIGGPLLIALSFAGFLAPSQPLVWTMRYTGAILAAEAALMTLSSLYGKRALLRRMIASLALRGDEHLLDVGCGRGMLLLEAARHLPRGHATGLDLWSTRDQSGNAAGATTRNAELAGLTERVQIDTGDMRRMPYPDASFDVIVSSLAIHNLPTQTDREQARARDRARAETRWPRRPARLPPHRRLRPHPARQRSGRRSPRWARIPDVPMDMGRARAQGRRLSVSDPADSTRTVRHD
ncbi:class I SAM-dependent methyltransferase [Rhodanobacter sp. 115]|uniref:SAM-dependent methyltransferase n=1 Tax=Rhodanobacter sp. FW021-MT20 TaxID=1162282 RepID=UPI000260DB45|nr:class I SAM-dependent methyltransferase [Rhodanobacter sp. 115]EIL91248.1 type 11 methyltransferase [Rhodanobacter sp. 115]